jgi:hypothetical protein
MRVKQKRCDRCWYGRPEREKKITERERVRPMLGESGTRILQAVSDVEQ